MSIPEDVIESAWQARREGRHDEAERMLHEAIGAGREMGSRATLIRALKALANVVRDQGHVDRAIPLYEEAVALSREDGDPLILAHTIRHLGDVHRETGRLADAARCYDEALALYRSAPNPAPGDFANALRPAALLKESEGDVDAARLLWADALRLYRAADVAPGVEECEMRLSRLA